MVMLAGVWRRTEMSTVPTMPSSRLTANEINVPMNVTSSTRTGITYQRGGRGGVGMVLSYHQLAGWREWSDQYLDEKIEIGLAKISGISKLRVVDLARIG